MALKVDDLKTFKQHRNQISESLSSELVGRELEIADLYLKIKESNCVALVGPAGVGKSRLAIGAIENYCSHKKDCIVLCTKSFSDSVTDLDNVIDDSRDYLIFIDDANNYAKLSDLLNYLDYKNKGNIKTILTIRDYLIKCICFKTDIVTYNVTPLSDELVEEAVKLNTKIKNQRYLEQIAKIANGNLRLAFMAANEALKNDKNEFAFIYNQKNVIDKFYKDEISKINDSEHLIIVAGIVAFFNRVYLKQLFYISPILKNVGISKQTFVDCVNRMVSMEIIDNYKDVVRISDQCFSDYLLNYVIIERKYLRVKDLILVGFKYYKKRIVESTDMLLHVYHDDDFVSYLKAEVVEACKLLENDTQTKQDIEICFGQIIPGFIVSDFVKLVDDYSDEKDIKCILDIFLDLIFTKYNSIANEGIFKLLEKTRIKTDDIFNAINEAYLVNEDHIKSSFVHVKAFIDDLDTKKIFNDQLFTLVTSYLKFCFNYSEWNNKKQLKYFSLKINDSLPGFLPLRKSCWKYLFDGFNDAKINSVIIDFAKYHSTENCVEIIKNDIICINNYLSSKENRDAIQSILYFYFSEESKTFGFEKILTYSDDYLNFFKLICETNTLNKDFDSFQLKHEREIKKYCKKEGDNVFRLIKELNSLLNASFDDEKNSFLNVFMESEEKWNYEIFSFFVENKLHPSTVIEKSCSSCGLDKTFGFISRISNNSIKDEYLYFFYSYIGSKDTNKNYDFSEWLKAKLDIDTKTSYIRNACNLKNVAARSNITYITLIKKLFNKHKYNEYIALAYLSHLFYEIDSFDELAKSSINLAIEIYEFLLERGKNDCKSAILQKILKYKPTYIKTVVKNFLDGKFYDSYNSRFVIDTEYCGAFFNNCVKQCIARKDIFISLNLRKLISDSIENVTLDKWISEYINLHHKDKAAMKTIFTMLSQVDTIRKGKYLIEYYQNEDDIDIIESIFHSQAHSFNDAAVYYTSEIKKLETLQSELISWHNTNIVAFIDGLIDEYKNRIKNDEIEKLIDYDNYTALVELENYDYKTEISLKDAFNLYVRDEKFREFLSSGYASYNDGCFVNSKNSPIKFVDKLNDKKIVEIAIKNLDEDDDKAFKYCLSQMKLIKNTINKDSVLTLDDSLMQLFNERKWGVNEFKENTSLSQDVFSKIKKNKKNKMEKKTIIAILVGLQLPKYQRDFLLELNGTQLSRYEMIDALYGFILDSKISIDLANELLKSLGEDGFIKKYE